MFILGNAFTYDVRSTQSYLSKLSGHTGEINKVNHTHQLLLLLITPIIYYY